MTPGCAQKSFSKASPYFFFCTDRAGHDGDRFNAVRLFRVISEDSAERDSLNESSSAYLIEGAQCALSFVEQGSSSEESRVFGMRNYYQYYYGQHTVY